MTEATKNNYSQKIRDTGCTRYTLQEVEAHFQPNGDKYWMLTLLDIQTGEESKHTTRYVLESLRSDPNFEFKDSKPKSEALKLEFKEIPGTVLANLLSGKSETDRQVILRWAAGESLSVITKELKMSRGRTADRLGIPGPSTREHHQAKLDFRAPHLVVLSLTKKANSVTLTILDHRSGKELTQESWWVFECLSKDPKYIFFPNEEERLNRMAENGTLALIEGLPVKKYAERIGASYSTVLKTLSTVGEQAAIDQLKNFKTQESILESTVASWVAEYSPIRNRKFQDTNFIPDIVLEKEKVVIECDGLYWHSDARMSSNSYHSKKRKAYTDAGYRPFFFREDELNKKPSLCRSILENCLKSNKKIAARKTQVTEETDSAFFEDNHLMGRGAGRVFALKHEQTTVAAIQVKARNRERREFEVSRFCVLPGVSVQGGFSKLITYVMKELNPRTLVTFIDLRYGSGEYLTGLGWTKVSTHISFRWTDCKGNSVGRMTFPGNSGYANGFHKIYDCGQAKWVLTPNRS